MQENYARYMDNSLWDNIVIVAIILVIWIYVINFYDSPYNNAF